MALTRWLAAALLALVACSKKPPQAPASLTGAPVPGGAALTWAASAGAISYAIFRATASGGPYTFVFNAADVTVTDSTMIPGRTYSYVVKAENENGQSGPSPEATVLVPPAAPIDVQATVTAAGAVALSWTATPGATSYLVQREPIGGPPVQLAQTTATSATDTTAAAGATYGYLISAVNESGPGLPSSEVFLTLAPPAPAGLSAALDGAGHVQLTFAAAAGATGYVVLRGDATGGPYTTLGKFDASPASDATGVAGHTYYYVVTATNDGGTGPASNEASIALPPPGARHGSRRAVLP